MTIDDFEISDNLQLNEKTLKMFQVRSNLAPERPYMGAIQIIK